MRANELRALLVFEYDANLTGSASRSGIGAPEPDWTELCQRRVNIRGIRAAEFFDLYQRYPEATYGIQMRHDTTAVTITSAMRARNASTGQTFTLMAAPVDFEGRRRELQIAAKEVGV